MSGENRAPMQFFIYGCTQCLFQALSLKPPLINWLIFQWDSLDPSTSLCSVPLPPKSVNPRAGNLVVRDILMQGGGAELGMFIYKRMSLEVACIWLIFFPASACVYACTHMHTHLFPGKCNYRIT